VKRNWDEKTLYSDHPVFGIGMSGWHKAEYWDHQEDMDTDFASQYPMSSDYTHACELLPSNVFNK
jgi:hypothetical protein